MLFFLSHWFQVPSKHISVLSLIIMINVVGGRDVTKNIPKIFLREKKKKEPQPHAELYCREIMLSGRQKMKCLLLCWGSDIQGSAGAWRFGYFHVFQARQRRACWEKENQNRSSDCWLSMAQWNICLDLKYLVSVTSVTQENSHTNGGQRHLLLLTESQLKILALQGEGNWQSFAKAGEGRSHLKDAMEEKEVCRVLCSCHVPLRGGTG